MTEPRIVVVTGASAGVGRATAVALGRRGAHVVALARGQGGLEGAVKEITSVGGTATAIPTDVADWDAVKAAADRVERDIGPIDAWINNAMTTVFAPIVEVHPDELKRATEVTYFGQVHGTLAALAHMRPRDRGAIVNVGSALAYRGIPLQAPYCGAKFACRGFTESVRAELLAEGSGVRISMVHLPAVDTPQFDWCRNKLPNQAQPVPPIYRPEQAADRIVAAVIDGRRADILGSWNWLIIQGSKVMPGIFDFYAARTGTSSQQTDEPLPSDRRDNLFEPVDDAAGGDQGAHGSFGDRSGGVLDPSFLRSLPGALGSLGLSVLDRVRDVSRFTPSVHRNVS